MSDHYSYWTHGVSIVPEYTKEYTGTDNGLFLHRMGFGALVRQKKGTSNWFHFPVPTPTRLDDEPVKVTAVQLHANVNNDAVIRMINIHEAKRTGGMGMAGMGMGAAFPGSPPTPAGQPRNESPLIFSSGDLNITGQNYSCNNQINDAWCEGPIVISVNIFFEGDHGEVVFIGAGANFLEMY